MDSTLNIALSHQTAMRRYLDLIANNLANMNTTAYRREQVMFQEYLTEMDGTENPAASEVAYVQDHGVRRDFSQGKFIPTGNPLDVAISGEAMLAVRKDGEDGDRYTRNGHLKIDQDGFLALDDGYRVLDDKNKAIPIAAADTNIIIAADGTISSSSGVIGRINLVSFADQQSLKKVGDGLYRTDETPRPAIEASLERGMLEGSNVNPILEMTDMMSVLRSYQSVQSLMDRYQDLRNQGIQQLGRLQ